MKCTKNKLVTITLVSLASLAAYVAPTHEQEWVYYSDSGSVVGGGTTTSNKVVVISTPCGDKVFFLKRVTGATYKSAYACSSLLVGWIWVFLIVKGMGSPNNNI